MNAQEIFDKVVTHLRTQKSRAMLGNSCAYRAPDGKMCAVGCLIPDELYDPKMENKGVMWLLVNKFTVPEFFKEHPNLLEELQTVHDMEENWNKNGLSAIGEEGLAVIARRHKLKYRRARK